MKEIFKEMEKEGKLIDPRKVQVANPLGKISCEVFSAEMERFKKGQVAFRDNPSLYHQMHQHASSCISCGIAFGEYNRK